MEENDYGKKGGGGTTLEADGVPASDGPAGDTKAGDKRRGRRREVKDGGQRMTAWNILTQAEKN